MEYYIHILSSLHIGSGNKYSAIDYFIYDNKCYFLPKKLLFAFLSEHNLTEKYNQWLNLAFLQLVELEEKARIKDEFKKNIKKKDYNQQLQQLKSKLNFYQFCKEHLCLEEFKHFINKLPYAHTSPSVPQGHDISAHIKVPNGTPFIPASSLKGTIRTALLYKWLCRYANKKSVQNLLSLAIKNAKKKIHLEKNSVIQKVKVDFAEHLEKSAFCCPFNSENNPDDQFDEKFDILKFLVLSDATPVNISNPSFEIIKPQLYLNDGTIGKQAPLLEALRPLQTFVFSASLNLDAILNIRKNFTAGSLVVTELNKKYFYWKNLSEKCTELFNFSPDELMNASPDMLRKIQQNAMNSIFDAVRDFSAAQAHFLMNWKKSISPNNQTKLKTFDTHSLFLPNPNSELILMNLGYASGFPATTAFLFLLNNHEFHDLTTEFFKLFKIGHPPKENKKFVFNLKKIS